MDTKWLEDYLYLAKCGSFAKAAKERNITQPAFGRRIKLLEEWVGTDLINRNTYPTTFTKAGFKFLEYANELNQQLNYIRTDIVKPINDNGTKITFHTQHALSEYVINNILTIHTDLLKHSMISVQPNDLLNSVQNFINSRTDFLIGLSFDGSELYIPSPEIDSIIIGDECLMPFVATKNNKSLYEDKPGVEVPLIHYPSNTFFAHTIDKHNSMNQSKCNFTTIYENSVTHSIKSMVLEGKGVAWLPLGFVQKELEEKKLTKFSHSITPIIGKIKLYRFMTEDISPEMTQLWEVMKNHTSQQMSLQAKGIE